MSRIAWIALGCLMSGVFVGACSGDGKTSTSSASTSSSGMSTSGGGAGGETVSSSSSSSSSGSSGTGGAGGCTTELQCSPSGPCKSVACVNGACVEDLVPAGTLVTSFATQGDCKRQECDAVGNVVVSNDDGDLPVDHNPCTLDVCTGGVPSNPVDSAKEGMGCGTGQAKCLAGKCQGCNSSGNCPSGGTCDKPVCDAQKVCGFVIDVGRLVSNTDPTDCFLKECGATGEVVTAPAPNEQPPQDTNECDIETCGLNGVQHNQVPDGTTCGGSTECHPRSCTGGTCADGPPPGNETKVAMQMAGDCKADVCDGAGGVVQINDDIDLPLDPNPNDCVIMTCTNGMPGMSNAPAGTACIQANNGMPGTCTISGVCS